LRLLERIWIVVMNAEVRRDLQPVVNFTERTGCAVIGITHLSKGTHGQDPIDRITGSVAFGAVARLAFLATREENSHDGALCRRVITRIKSNIGPDGGGFYYDIEPVELPPGINTSKVTWLGVAEGNAREIIGLAEVKDDEHQASALDEAVDFLRQELAEGPVPARDLFKKAPTEVGITKSTLYRAKKKAGAKAIKQAQRGGKGPWLWYLLPDDQQSDQANANTDVRYQGGHDSDFDDVDDLGRAYQQGTQAAQDHQPQNDDHLATLNQAPDPIVEEGANRWVEI
jgi:hypothetical protein